MKTTVEGLDELEQDLEAKFRSTFFDAASAIYIEGEETISKAKPQTPVDEGPLRNSGHVQPPEMFVDEIDVELGFGGPAGAGNQGGETNDEDVGYAVYVHEDLTAQHNPPTKAKYLEDPVEERRSGMTNRVVRRMRQRAKR